VTASGTQEDLARFVSADWASMSWEVTFVILRGYIDDAKDGKTFNLSALVGDGRGRFYLEQDWRGVMEKKNRSLTAITMHSAGS
jgi:hypothetical protein